MSNATPRWPADPKQLELLYQENAKIAAAFFEWRHKLMTFSFSVMTVLGAVAGWLYVHDLGRLVAAPLLLASLLSVECAALELRNRGIIRATYDIGADLERALGATNGSILSRMGERPAGGLSYSRILPTVFVITALGFGALGSFYLVEPPHYPITGQAARR